jgi:hypothetical protein
MPFPFCRPRPLGRRARPGVFALPALLLGVLATGALAGCAGIGSDPLVAATAAGHSISLAAYERVFGISEDIQAGQGQPLTWQTPDGRSTLASVQTGALDLLIDAALFHDQVLQQHLAVSTKDVDASIKQFATNVEGSLSQSPDNSGWQELDRGAKDALRQHLSSRDLFDLLAGRPSVADIAAIVGRDNAEQQALVTHGKVPTAHIRLIETATLQSAQHLEKLAQAHTDFGQLARQNSLDQSTAAQGGEFGTVHVGELSFFDATFNKHIFGTPASQAPKVEYAILPYNGKYALLEITHRSFGRIADVDQQVQGNVYTAWFNQVVRPAAHIQNYLAIDATPTPTPAPQGP